MKTSKFLAVLGLAVLGMGAQSAKASGFLCGTFDRELLIQVATAPTTTPSPVAPVVTLTDPDAPRGRELIVQSRTVDVVYTQAGPSFHANTNGALIGPNRYLGGINVRDVQWIITTVNTASGPSTQGTNLYQGSLEIHRLNGQVTQKLLSCTVQ